MRLLPGWDRDRDNAYFSNYGLNRVSIGGAGNDRGAMLVDRVPAEDPFGGQVDWSLVPAVAITSSQILVGPGSALYGSGAIGGALDLRTFGASGLKAPVTYGQVTTGSLTQSAALLAGAPIGQHWSAGVWGETSRTSFNALPPSYQSFNSTDAVTVTGATRASIEYASGGVTVDAGGVVGSDAQQEGRPNYDFWRSERQVDLAATLHSGNTQVQLAGYDRASTLVNTNDAFPKKPGTLLYTQILPDSDNGIAAGAVETIGDGSILARFENRVGRGQTTQSSGTGAFQYGGSGVQATTSGILQGTYESRLFALVAGARFDAISTAATSSVAGTADLYQAAVSPRAALSYSLGDVVFRGYGGGGLRAPFLNELVRGYSIGTITYAPSLDLIPERSTGDGIGIDVENGFTRLSADVQNIIVHDALDFRTVSPTLQVRSNIGETKTNAVMLAFSSPQRCTTLTSNASVYDATIAADKDPAIVGKRVPYVPEAEASFGIAGGRAVQAGTTLTYIGPSYADDRNTQKLGSALVIDAFVSTAIGKSSIQLGASNMVNAIYLSSPDRLAPPPGIWLRFSNAPRPKPCTS